MLGIQAEIILYLISSDSAMLFVIHILIFFISFFSAAGSFFERLRLQNHLQIRNQDWSTFEFQSTFVINFRLLFYTF